MDNLNNELMIFINEINKNSNKNGIISMFKKGPPKDRGFMFCDSNDNIYWTKEESDGLKTVSDMVLNRGWDSSGYGIMMRNIQHEINKLQ